ncbi:MAG: hypothetical protein E7323_00925 [Clostridiales bacterium]|nr:hypothetical protein [Clostridiales bacterium]
MSQKRNQSAAAKAAWPLGLLLSSVMMACVLLFFSLRYANNDDTMILRQMMGFGVEELPDFNMCVTFVMLYPLRWLSLAFPGMPWFSYLQLFCLWLATVVCVKSILQCFAQADRPLWQGLLASLLFMVVFVLRYESQVTFTITAALLGCAAVLQLMSIDTEHCTDGQWIASALLALLMAVLGYGMRETTALPTLAICGVAFVVQGWRRWLAGRQWLKPLAITAAAVVMVFGACVGIRAWEIASKPGIRQYMDWQDARSRVWDFLGVENIPQETLDEYQISDARHALLYEWYLMDGDMDTEALLAIGDAIEAATDQRFSARTAKALALLAKLPAQDPLAMRSLTVLGAMALACILMLCLGGKRSRLPQIIGLILGAVLFAVMIFYLALTGRLPMRVALTAALPLAALITGLFPLCMPSQGSLPAKSATALACAAVMALGVLYAIPMFEANLQDEMTFDEEMAETTFAAIDDYASCNEEYLLILDPTLSGDTRMFPTTEFGIPKNMHFWGGWNLHHPSYDALLESYGFDPYGWSLEDFLNEDVRILRGVVDTPQLLMDALSEICEVDCYLDSEWDGLYSMYFEEW